MSNLTFKHRRRIRKMRELEEEKLAAEIQSIRHQFSPATRAIEWTKAIAGLAGVITAIVALIGIYLSIEKTRIEEKRLLDSDRREQMNSSISLLADENPAKQLAGITELNSFYSSEDALGQIQILTLLASILAVEENKIVRDSIVASVNRRLAAGIDKQVMTGLLRHLVTESNALITQGKLSRSRKGDEFGHLETKSIEARAISISEIIQAAVRKGTDFKEFTGIYCFGCDFSGLDLDNVNFRNSILFHTDFSGSVLTNSNFEAADLEEALFVGADLRNANFSFTERPKSGKYRSSYAEKFSEKSSWSFHGPNFNCADLRQAIFSGHPIFAITYPEDKYFMSGGSFIGADIDGVTFTSTELFGKIADDDHNIPFASSGGGSISDDVYSFVHEWAEYSTNIPDKYRRSFENIANLFAGSNWRKSDLPPPIRTFFDDHPPSNNMHFSFRSKPCNPRMRDGFHPKLALEHRERLSKQEVIQAVDGAELDDTFRLIRWKLNKSHNLTENDKVILTFQALLTAIEDRMPIIITQLNDNEDEAEILSALPTEVAIIFQEADTALKSLYRENESLKDNKEPGKHGEINSYLISMGVLDKLIENNELVAKSAKNYVATNRNSILNEFSPYYDENN